MRRSRWQRIRYACAVRGFVACMRCGEPFLRRVLPAPNGIAEQIYIALELEFPHQVGPNAHVTPLHCTNRRFCNAAMPPEIGRFLRCKIVLHSRGDWRYLFALMRLGYACLSSPWGGAAGSCSNGLPCPSPLGRSGTRESKSMIRGSSGYWRFSSMPATPSAAGPPDRSTKPSSPRFSSLRRPTG